MCTLSLETQKKKHEKSVSIPHRDLWQKLYAIQNKVNKPCNFNLKYTDDAIISRICTVRSRLIHSYHLKGKQQPECIFCDCPLTVQHVF